VSSFLDKFGYKDTPTGRVRPTVDAPTIAPRARVDAATTTDENRRHWANADGLGPNAAFDPLTRAKVRNRGRYETLNNSYCRGTGPHAGLRPHRHRPAAPAQHPGRRRRRHGEGRRAQPRPLGARRQTAAEVPRHGEGVGPAAAAASACSTPTRDSPTPSSSTSACRSGPVPLAVQPQRPEGDRRRPHRRLRQPGRVFLPEVPPGRTLQPGHGRHRRHHEVHRDSRRPGPALARDRPAGPDSRHPEDHVEPAAVQPAPAHPPGDADGDGVRQHGRGRDEDERAAAGDAGPR
jgi:hypothetical protein